MQVFDANGNSVLNLTYRVLRVLGSIQLEGLSGTRTDDRLAQGGFVSFQPAVTGGDGYLAGGVIAPRFSIAGGVLTWTYPNRNSSYDTIQKGVLFYGAS
ncbi:hypothetical protein IQ288_13400 [Burkholderia sp. R-69980]|nr:hypothetical protein [Burkholderia sp. R-69980]